MILAAPHRWRCYRGTGLPLLVGSLCLLIGHSIAAAPAPQSSAADQASALVDAARNQAQAAGLSWTPEQVESYTLALRESFTQCVSKPLDKHALADLTASHQEWLRFNVDKSPKDITLTADAVRYAVCLYAKRSKPSKAVQNKLDAQIDQFLKVLTAAVQENYPGEQDVIKAEVARIREELRRDSRNLLFPSLKQPYEAGKAEEVRQEIIKAVKQNAEALRGKTLTVPLPAASAWAGTVTFVRLLAAPPPAGKAMNLYGGPKSEGIKVEIRSGFGFGTPAPPTKPPPPVKWP